MPQATPGQARVVDPILSAVARGYRSPKAAVANVQSPSLVFLTQVTHATFRALPKMHSCMQQVYDEAASAAQKIDKPVGASFQTHFLYACLFRK